MAESTLAEAVQTWSDDHLQAELQRVDGRIHEAQRERVIYANEIARRYVPCGTEPRCGGCPECLDMAFGKGS